MAPGRKALRKVQFGRESTPGTAVAATVIWRGPAALLEDDREPEFVEEDVGLIGGTDRTHITHTPGKISFAETSATFEQLQHPVANMFGGPVAGVADGAGTGRIYTNPIPTTGAPATNRAWTIEGGDDTEVEQAAYAKVSKLTLSGASNKPVMVGFDAFSRAVAPLGGGFTAALSLVAVEDILFNLGKLYLDPVASAYGTTQVAKQWHGFKLTIESLWVPLTTGDGSLDFQLAHYAGHKISGEVTFLHDTAALGNSGEKANWRTQTPRRMQMRFEGSSFATAGTTYSKKTLILNLPIKWKKFGPLADNDGVDIVVGQFESRYNTTSGDAGSIIIVNDQATLP